MALLRGVLENGPLPALEVKQIAAEDGLTPKAVRTARIALGVEINRDGLADIRDRALASLIPPPRIALSDWIEENIRLPEGVSALPGQVRLWQHQRGIADAISDPEIERVTLVKPVRVGFTTLLTGAKP